MYNIEYNIFTLSSLGFPIQSALFSNCHLSIVIWVIGYAARQLYKPPLSV